MKDLYSRNVTVFLLLYFFSNFIFAVEKNDVEVLHSTMKAGYIKNVTIKVDGNVQEIKLPSSGAREKSFSISGLRWGGSRMLGVTLDDRGQIPSVAYFQIEGKKSCFVGEHSLLSFDNESNFVVEPMHSSASEQVINRYKLKKCELSFYDQLVDKAVEADDPDVITRRVIRVKGVDLPRYECDYTIKQGKILDADNCFRK